MTRGGGGQCRVCFYTKQIHFNNVTGEAETLCERMIAVWWVGGGGVNTSVMVLRGEGE